MNVHPSTIEAAYNKAAGALGIEPQWDKPLVALLKRRDAAQALADMKPRDAAAELTAAPNPRQWDSILGEIAAHNIKVTEAKAAIRNGGVLATTQAQLGRALTLHLPTFTDQVHDTVAGLLATLADTAQDCPSLDAESAVRGGFGDSLTQLHRHAHTIRAYTTVGTVTAPADRAAQAARALSLICDPGTINPIKRTQPTRWSAPGGELKSGPEDVARKDATHTLISAWVRDEVDTLRRLALREFDGFELSAATAEDYEWRVTQFANSQRTVHVDD